MRVAAGEQVLRRQQPLLERRRDTALQQDRLAHLAHLPQQRVVLHVAGAELIDVDVLVDQLDLAGVHDLGDQPEAVLIGAGAQHAQPLLAVALEAVRRRARLEGAAAQELAAGALDRGGGGVDLFVGLRRARPGHDDDLVAPDPHVAHVEHRVLALEGAAGEFVRLGDAHHFVHPVEDLEQPRITVASRAHRAEHGALGAGRAVHVEPLLDEVRDDVLDLLFGGAFCHHDNHGPISSAITDARARPSRVRGGGPRR